MRASAVLLNSLLVGAGGFIGAIARYLVALAMDRPAMAGFPWGTLAINVSGSFFIGVLLARYHEPSQLSVRLLFVTGFLGAYTTFSTFMYDSNDLIRGGFPLRAMLNLVGSLALGLCLVRAGIWIGSK